MHNYIGFLEGYRRALYVFWFYGQWSEKDIFTTVAYIIFLLD